jgi:uncharacterized protein
MNPQITAILLGVKDLDRAKQFYSEGLGCPIEKDYPGFVSSISAATRRRWRSTPGTHSPRDAGVASDGSGFRGVTLNYIVPSAERVDEVLAEAERAGGKIVKPAQQAQWGYFGYFSDLDGHLWKVASE